MRGKLFLFSLLLTSIAGFSQVGIGTTLPNSSSQLEVNATNKGILIPRVALTSNSDATTITNGNVTSLLVYNTSTVTGTTGVTPGFYYWSGSKWHQILNKDNIAALDATNDAFNNNTTTNVVELNTKSDGTTLRDANTEFVIQDIGNVGVGTATPNASALVDIMAANKGMLIPRVALTGLSDNSTISNGNVTSLLVFNTNTTTEVVPGFYYWSAADSKWHQILNKDNIAALDATNDAFNNNTTTNVVELNTKSDGTTLRDANTEFVIQDIGNVGVGTATPNASALLDVNAVNKGMLIPRVSLQHTLDNTTITNGNVTSLLVYNEQTSNDVVAGFYYWMGTKWTKIINSDDILAALNTVDLRLVGADTHMTKDAGVGGTGTDQGTGSRNIFIGKETGFSNTAGNGNVFVGDRAGRANTTGASNYFIGRDAGMQNTTGFANLFMGRSAGYSNVSGVSNVFLGYRSGYVNSTGSYNLFLGSDAGYGNTTGYENIFLGRQSGRNNQTGRVNTFIGSNAGYQNTTGEYNNFLGAYAGQFNTEGVRNIFIGLSAGRNNTTASNNIFIGDAAGQNNGVNGQNNIFLGKNAGLNNNSTDNVFIGGNAGEKNTEGRYGVYLGREAGYANTTANANVNIGHQAGRNSTTGNSTVNIGYRAGFGDAGGATGNQNVNIGFEAGNSLSTGRDNVFIGYKAGRSATTTYRNTIVGNIAGTSLTTGTNNTFYGANAAPNATTAHQNAIFGYYSATGLTTGSNNAIFGAGAGQALTTASNNTFVGNTSGNTTTTGAVNTFIGREAGNTNITGNDNIALGYRAAGFVNGSRNIVIGHRVSVNDGDFQLNIGNIIFGAGVNNTSGTDVSKGSIGLGTAAPKANAILDMSDVTNKGVLMPKVALTSTTDVTTVDIRTIGTEISKNMLVYNTATVADVTPGYYYWNGFRTGGKWEKLIGETDLVNNSVFAANAVGSLVSNSFSTPGRPNYNYRNASFIVGSDTMNDIPKTDDDRKMYFNRPKAAFRAGHVESTQWDDTNVGYGSVAFGQSTTASGMLSFSGGYSSVSSGIGAFSYGFFNNVSGASATSFGSTNTSSGTGSASIGLFLSSEAYAQTTLGYYNTAVAGNATAAVATDRLFVLGNGTASTRSDALTVLKNGNTTINGSLALNSTDGGFLMPKVALTGTSDAATITAGNVEGLLVYNTATVSDVTPGFYSWNGTAWAAVGGSSSGGAFTTTANVTSNSPGDVNTDDFVFGSTQLNDNTATSNDDAKFFFDKGQAAFRAGYTDTDAWDTSNLGWSSVALGYNTKAIGPSSFAAGQGSVADGGNSIALGFGAITDDQNAIALGNSSQALWTNSIAIGTSAISSASNAISFGSSNSSTANNAISFGNNNTANGRFSLALGYNNTANSWGETTLGNFATEIAGVATASIPTDRLFVIGNGTTTTSRSDALTVLKNGNTTINGSLALNSTDGGFLMPKVALTGTSDAATITAGNVEGLMVYNTATVADVTPGFYSWNGTAWAAVGGGSSLGDLRVVEDRNHITSDAGFGGLGTSAGAGDPLFGSTSWNIFIGDKAGNSNVTGGENTFIGANAGYNNTSGSSNINIGTNSGFNNTAGIHNYAIGANALNKNSTGNTNLGFGYYAGGANVDGSYNTSIGNFTGMAMTTGSKNLILGYRAGRTDLTSGNNNILLGNDVSMPAGDNQLNIGGIIFGTGVNNVLGTNVSTGNIGIGVNAPTERLDVGGNIKASGNIQTGTTTYPDYVFENYLEGSSNIDKTYTFKSLTEVESFIKANKHLPGVTGINELKKTKNGYEINLTKLSTQTLEKVEELYLHTIAQQKKIDKLKAENDALKTRLSKIEAVLGIK